MGNQHLWILARGDSTVHVPASPAIGSHGRVFGTTAKVNINYVGPVDNNHCGRGCSTFTI